jgi:flagellar biosynthetic protein FliP
LKSAFDLRALFDHRHGGASILMSMGMMMLPPVIISLPFKLIFFVLVDGWRLIAGSLVQSYMHSPPPT